MPFFHNDPKVLDLKLKWNYIYGVHFSKLNEAKSRELQDC